MIVVDTNVIAYLFIPGSHSRASKALLQTDTRWAAPLLWRSEFRNVLATYLRQGHITLDQALFLAEEAEYLMKGREYTIPSSKVLSLVNDSQCSAYDCEFVALAQDLNTKLVTSDRKILKAFPKVAVSLERYSPRES